MAAAEGEDGPRLIDCDDCEDDDEIMMITTRMMTPKRKGRRAPENLSVMMVKGMIALMIALVAPKQNMIHRVEHPRRHNLFAVVVITWLTCM